MKSFLIALQFLTRFPLRTNSGNDPEIIGRSLLWYPLVGALIGALLYAMALFVKNHSGLLAAAIILVVWVLITGGLHLDGLADSADAWAGGFGDREKTLDIMKDPHTGSMAIVVLLLVLLLKFSALSALLQSGNMHYLLLAPMLGRSAVIYLFLTTPYVRQQGLGTGMAHHLPRVAAIFVLAVFVVPALILQPVAVIAAGLVLTGLRYLMLQRIAGMTGDTLGASIEITEAVVLAGLVLSCAS